MPACFAMLLCCLLPLLQGALTVLPLRCLRSMWQLLISLSQSAIVGKRSSSSSSKAVLSGAQLYDLLCVMLLLAAVLMLSLIKPGVIYYWMKDITTEFLKIQVLFSALEILDKVGRAAGAGDCVRLSVHVLHVSGGGSGAA